MVRKAEREDIEAVAALYREVIEQEEQGKAHTGWVRGVYPTRAVALEAMEKGELFVWEEEGAVVASAKIDREQVPEYRDADWTYEAPDDEIMVLHTLVVSPAKAGRGIGSGFVEFYEKYAVEQGCRCLRMDTNAVNAGARRLYKRLGYQEVGIVPCNFHGIENVQLVCLEKKL